MQLGYIAYRPYPGQKSGEGCSKRIMKLPNREYAIVEIDKIVDYCLNLEHPEGKHKARVFKSALGLNRTYAKYLSNSDFSVFSVPLRFVIP